MTKITKNDKIIDILNWIAAKIMKNDEKSLKMTKPLTFLNMVTAKQMNNYRKIQKLSRNDKKTFTFSNMIATKIMKSWSS